MKPAGNADTAAVSFPSRWWVAIRPFALPASTMPVMFGGLLAAIMTRIPLHIPHFFCALLAMILLHSGANILSDVSDFRRGLDREPTPVSGAVVRGILTPRQALGGAVVFFVAGILPGLWLAWRTTWLLLPVGAAGVAIGFFYTRGRFLALKYHALGDAAVMTAFGLLGALGAWMVQTGVFAWTPLVYSLPMALLVVAILHANNWRDIPSDRACGISTPAMLLGDRGSMRYFHALVGLPFLLVPLFVILPRWFPPALSPLPTACLVSLAALPEAMRLLDRSRRRHTSTDPLTFVALDGATARLNLVFGLLMNGGLAFQLLLLP